MELLSKAGQLTNGAAWRCLYHAAEDMGVNITALVTQLRLEGWITVTPEGTTKVIRVQPPLQEMS